MTEVFLEQPLALPGFANKLNLNLFIFKYIFIFLNILLNAL